MWTGGIVGAHCCISLNLGSLLNHITATIMSDHIIATITLDILDGFDIIVAFIIPLVVLLTLCGIKNAFGVSLYSKA
jgi:hypothetical protein